MDVSLSHQCFSPSLSPSLPLSLKSVSMSLDKDKKKKTINNINDFIFIKGVLKFVQVF